MISEGCVMKEVAKTLLKRFLMSLGAIFVWVKALAGASQALIRRIRRTQERDPRIWFYHTD